MGLLDIFGKKAPSMPLVDQVVDMRQRGMPDQAIVQNLQAQRVAMPELQDAMMQADIKMRVGGPSPSVSASPQMLPQSAMPPQGMEYQGPATAGMMAPPPLGGPQMMMGPQPMGGPQQMAQQMMMGPQPGMMGPPQIPPEFLAPSGGVPPQQQQQQQQMAQQMMGPLQQFGPPQQQGEMQMGPPPGGPMYPSPMPQMGISTEELVEKIVSEKMDRLEKRLSDQEKIHSDLLQEIGQVRSSLNDLKGKYSQLQEDSVVKIEEYNKELEGVGTQIKAMQRVMQNIIPTFAENVRSLTEVVKELKGGPGQQQQQQQPMTRQAQQQQQQQRQPPMPPQQSSRRAMPPATAQSRSGLAGQQQGSEEEAGEPWQARVRKIGKPQGTEEDAGGFESSLM